MFNPRRRGGAIPGLAIWLLLMQMMRVGFDRIPPVTLVTIIGQVLIHLRHNVGLLRWVKLPSSVGDVCVSALHAWYRDDWRRLVLAAFYHVDDMHLYFNMTSLLWKGLRLERRFGSPHFGCMLAVFAVLVNILLVAFSMIAEHVTHDGSYVAQCAVGFSGVLFALKVVSNYMDPPGIQYVMGIFPVPTKLVCWAELVLIHLMVPNASFLGHLAGIIVGLFYVKGPLGSVFDTVFHQPHAPQYSYSGTSGYGDWRHDNTPQQPNSSPSAPPQPAYQQYAAGLSEEDQMAEATRQSLRNGVGAFSGPQQMPQPPPESQQRYYPTAPPAVSADEVRRRRLERFANNS